MNFIFPELVSPLFCLSTAEWTAWLSDWGLCYWLTGWQFMKLDYCWSTAHLPCSLFSFSISLVYIYLSENNTMAWKFYLATFSPQLALSSCLSLSLNSVCLSRVDENNRGSTATKYYRTIVCCYFFLRLAYLVGKTPKIPLPFVFLWMYA